MPKSEVIRALKVVAAGFAPIVFVWLLPLWIRWQAALPEIFEPSGDPTAVSELLGNLSLSLSSIAIACVIGAAVILKERSASRRRFYPVILTTAAVGACLTTVYAGLWFQLALAEQISLYRLNMEVIQDRLVTQAAAALVGASATISLAVESFLLPHPSTKVALRRRPAQRLQRNRRRHRAL